MDNQLLDNFSNYNDDFDFSAAPEAEKYQFVVPDAMAGMRLDAVIAQLLPDFSRSRLSRWLKQGCILINEEQREGKIRVIGGECIDILVPVEEETLAFTAEDIPLKIVHEDSAILVLNKPAGLVVHPAAGNWHGTLLNGLLHYCPDLKNIPRAGIVHRLDKDTSGLMVVAKTLSAQNHLVSQLQNRTVKRIYRAVTTGVVPYDGKIDTLIGRDPHNRLKMAVVKFSGKQAVTHIKVLERYAMHTYIECSLETGRTHQIRVHMKAANCPLAGDPVYGNVRAQASAAVADAIRQLNRQALHALSLSFIHPQTEETVRFQSALPDDIQHLLSVLRLESGRDSQLSAELSASMDEENDDWNEDDYDVETYYVPDN